MPLAVPKDRSGVKTASHRHAPKQEKATAKRLGADLVKGSGCGDVKGDVRKRRCFRLECKSTTRKSFSLTRELIEKIEAAAMGATEIPVFEIDFLNTRTNAEHRIAVLPVWALEMLLEQKYGSDPKSR